MLSAGAGQTLSVTFTPTDTASYNAATATVAMTVLKATPLITWATPADIASGTPLSATQLNATANVAGTFTYTPPSGTVLGVGAGQTLSATFTPTSTTNYNTATKTVSITVTGTPTTRHNAARANSYDDAWQGGVERMGGQRESHSGRRHRSVPGLVLWIGDSLTRDPALGAWAQRGAGKTADDQMITELDACGAVAAEHRQHRRLRAGDAVFLLGAKLHRRRRPGRLGLHGHAACRPTPIRPRRSRSCRTAPPIRTRST